MIKRLSTLCALMLVLSACANDPVPTEQMRLTGQTLEQVQTLGVQADSSPLLKLAQAKYEKAQVHLAEGDNKQARFLAEQAELDTRLAEARHLSLKSQEQLDALNQRITRLRKQLGAVQ